MLTDETFASLCAPKRRVCEGFALSPFSENVDRRFSGPGLPVQDLTSAEMRSTLVELIKGATDARVRGYYHKITKKHVHRSCAVQ